METKIPGFKAQHCVISDACRRTHGSDGAQDIAVCKVRDALTAALKGWPQGKGAQFHLVLTIERPS